ncbi:hypothetical protein kam1_1100 [Methylacidiphilum kamchatkense Kam1]|uniref:Uncharacterized protein n=1 Tax=Methylacidiphilum kamchatkense Kam1 TaxID=1202785 RepID=A0A516TM61_9BACT|nr:hypothetical protein kam1_1100 [Methylacidiphilum kamchatkense Kam1]
MVMGSRSFLIKWRENERIEKRFALKMDWFYRKGTVVMKRDEIALKHGIGLRKNL